MSLDRIGLLNGISARMNFLDQRQQIIAQNVANADTPHYRPEDLRPVDFSRIMGRVGESSSESVRLARTHSAHQTGGGDQANMPFKVHKQRHVYEVAPAGNAVVLEEQMVLSARTSVDYALMTNVYQKNINLIRAAIAGGR